MRSHIPKSFYKSLFDNMADGFAYCQMIFDEEGMPVDFRHIKINKNFEKLTGLKKVIGLKATKIIPGIFSSNPELFEVYGRVSLTGKPERFEIYIEQLSQWFFISVYSPKKEFFAAVFQNITDRKNTEKSLEDAKVAARNVLEDLGIEKAKVEMARAKEEAILLSIGDGLLATDKQGIVILVNKTAEKILGKKIRSIMGKPFSEVICIEDEKGVPIPYEKHPVCMALAKSIPDLIPPVPANYYMRKDAAQFPVAIMATPVILGGEVIGTIEVFRDITREREIDRAKSEFVSLASHQLRTPLTTISWYTEMILHGDVGEVAQSQRKYLEEIYQGNQRMIGLVNTLLDVSRIELGTFNFKPKPTDVVALAQSVLGEQKLKIEQKNLLVTQKFSPDVPIVSTDPKLLHVVFQNILANALEYTPPGGKVEFSIFLKDKKTVCMQISDTGYGIPKNQQDQIFTKLFRADNIREKDPDGTGLGLYIVKSIIENSGGKIWFESEENHGSTFFTTLPLHTT